MKLVIFGLTISSSWGNGHATLWRGLLRAFAKRGHDVVFFERDVPYYAAHRDLRELESGRLRLYADWADVRHDAARELDDADAGMVTSYCPDGVVASDLVLDSSVARRVFYDLDTPVTLSLLATGQEVVAIVQLRENVAPSAAVEQSLLDECAKHIARYKLPKAFVFVDRVVRSPAGKADYRWAREVAVD